MTKACTRCGRELALDAFNKQANGRHGRKSWCRECQAQYRRAHYEANRERENAQCRDRYWRDPEAMRDRNRRYAGQRYEVERAEREAHVEWERREQRKRCGACGQMRAFADYYRDQRHRHGLYSWCKECFRAHGRATYDPAEARERHHRWRQRPESREVERAKTRRWREANPEHFARLNREAQARRRVDPTAPIDYAALLAEHGHVCHICGDAIEGELHFDHVIPLARGGAHSADNIRPAHGRCNRWKKDRLMAELESAL